MGKAASPARVNGLLAVEGSERRCVMSRRATVMECGPSLPKGAVELRFRGLWLKGCGFDAADRVRVVVVSHGVLELRVERPGPVTEGFAEAMAGFEGVGL